MSITTVNGRNKEKTTVLETEMITDTETLEAVETDVHPQPEIEKKEKPRSKKRLPLILAGLGVGAIAAGSFGYKYWQYASTHEETDNATGNFTKVVQRIPVKIVLDQKSMQGYDSRITPGMSAEVTVEVK